MLKIAICDDRKKNADEIGAYVDAYFRASAYGKYEVTVFFDGEELLENIKKHSYDIYFLDILMPGLNGVELGGLIREENKKAVIVYITVSREFSFEAFGVRAFQYLQKPVKKEKLFEVLNEIVSLLERKASSRVCIRTKEGLVNVKIEDVIYVENIARCAVYRLKNGKQVVSVCNRGTFEKSVSPLNENCGFVQPHKSYFVNMHYIHTFANKCISLDDGTQIAVSRKRFAEAKRLYLEFLADEGEIL